MKLRTLALLLLVSVGGCVMPTEENDFEEYLRKNPFRRAVSAIPFSWSPGIDSSMDACVAIFKSRTYYDSTIEDNWNGRAAFNDGENAIRIGGISFSDQSFGWDADYLRYEHYAGTGTSSEIVSISNYAGADLYSTPDLAGPTLLIGTSSRDTISKSKGKTFHYTGAVGGQLMTSYAFIGGDAAKGYDTVGSYWPWTQTEDNGSLTITPEHLKSLPVNTLLRITFSHDKFTSTLDSKGHKIGFYSSYNTSYYFDFVE